MNRQVNFRGISQRNNKFVFGSLFKADTGLTIIENGGSEMLDFHFVNEKSIGQFTGLQDVHGVEIYEGDIVEDEELGRGIVVFQSGCFFMMYDAETNMEFLGLKSDEFGRLQKKRIVEVIGNIYEHKNLLENEK